MRREFALVLLGGVVQGTALVTFPAVATVLTDARVFGFSAEQYGLVFAPQYACAIVTALAGAALARRAGIKAVLLAGLGADVASMALLFAGGVLTGDRAAAFADVLLATACLGTAFGLVVPALNALAAAMSPNDPDRAVLLLNSLLGIGTVLAPVLASIFVGAGVWWALPLLAGALTVALALAYVPLSLEAPAEGRGGGGPAGAANRMRLALFLGAAVLYGIVETTNGNWGELEIVRAFSAGPGTAPFALIAFWAAITAGRFVFGSFEKRFPPRVLYRVLPLVAAAALAGIARASGAGVAAGTLAFGLAGLGCSALLPLTISFAQREFASRASAVGGALIAFYQIGNGLAVFAVGPLLAAHVASLATVFAGAACGAVLFCACAFAVTK